MDGFGGGGIGEFAMLALLIVVGVIAFAVRKVREGLKWVGRSLGKLFGR